MSKQRLYIAYGSNLNLPQMAYRCPTAKPVVTAFLKNHELVFRGGRYNAVATVEPNKSAIVPVLVWDIKPQDEIALDHYEGYPTLYGKQMMDIELDGVTVAAMVYTMTPGHQAGYPSDYYLNVIAEGYKSAGFDPDILDAAVERSGEIMAEEMGHSDTGIEHEQNHDQSSLFELKWW